MSKRKSDEPKPIPTWQLPAYLEECEQRAKWVKVRYIGSEEWAICGFIKTWRRDDAEVIRGQIMSASSGPKDYLRNDVIGLFSEPDVDAVSLFHLGMTPLVILRRGGKLEDVTGRPVEIYWEKAGNAERS